MPMFAVVLAGMVTFGKVTELLENMFIPIMTALSVELVKFRMLIFATGLGAETVTPKFIVMFHRVGNEGATNVLDEGTQ
jgi:hypothetical protein